MRTSRIQPLLFALCLSALTAPAAHAWSAYGHQTVGRIADQLIAGSNAEKQVRTLLGNITLKDAAVWADCAKGVTENDGVWKYSVNPRYRECQPFETTEARKAAMVDFVSRNAEHCGPGTSDLVCRHKSYHYTDVSNLRDHYDKDFTGTSDHDIVSAIKACILVLQGKPAPVPFNIKNKKEALLLLAHYMGDIHQPLHVAAVYLDKDGHIVDPDAGAFDSATETRGGNDIDDGSEVLHGEWDSIPSVLATTLQGPDGVTEAGAVPKTRGAMIGWPTSWASDTLRASSGAFKPLSFGKQNADEHWPATHANTYAKARRDLQRKQLVKGGARLAQILTTLWP